jgi:hypothetical protein
VALAAPVLPASPEASRAQAVLPRVVHKQEAMADRADAVEVLVAARAEMEALRSRS